MPVIRAERIWDARARHRVGTALVTPRQRTYKRPLEYLVGEGIDWKMVAFGGQPSQHFNVAPNWIDPIHKGHQHARNGL